RDEVAHRPAVLHRGAEVEPHGGSEPGAVLRADRLVEAEPRALALDRLPRGLRAERFGDVIARRKAREHERRRRDGDDEEQREGDSPDEITGQGFRSCLGRPWSPPGDAHVACPVSSRADGRGPTPSVSVIVRCLTLRPHGSRCCSRLTASRRAGWPLPLAVAGSSGRLEGRARREPLGERDDGGALVRRADPTSWSLAAPLADRRPTGVTTRSPTSLDSRPAALAREIRRRRMCLVKN